VGSCACACACVCAHVCVEVVQHLCSSPDHDVERLSTEPRRRAPQREGDGRAGLAHDEPPRILEGGHRLPAHPHKHVSDLPPPTPSPTPPPTHRHCCPHHPILAARRGWLGLTLIRPDSSAGPRGARRETARVLPPPASTKMRPMPAWSNRRRAPGSGTHASQQPHAHMCTRAHMVAAEPRSGFV